MIFVTVGTAINGVEFDRLVMEVDRIAPAINDKIILQKGSSGYVPRNVEWLAYLSFGEALEYFRSADVVVGHCGTGTAINALSAGTPLIVVPRRAHLAENDDDHQVEIAAFLERNGLARVVYDIGGLEQAIRAALSGSARGKKEVASPQRRNLIEGIRNYIGAVGERKG